jgi:hypothetical protein
LEDFSDRSGEDEEREEEEVEEEEEEENNDEESEGEEERVNFSSREKGKLPLIGSAR